MWLYEKAKKKVGNLLGYQSEDEKKKVAEAEDSLKAEDVYSGPCSVCESPCKDHPNLPASLAKRINHDKSLLGTVKPYAKHLIVCTGKSDWATKPTKEPETFTKALADEVKKQTKDLDYRILICTSSVDCADPSKPDVLLFPGNWIFRGVSAESLPQLVALTVAQPVLEKATPLVPSDEQRSKLTAASDEKEATLALPSSSSSSLKAEKLPAKAYVFVCTHKRRDKRCGVAGPLVVSQFQKEFETRKLDSSYLVYGLSHPGGHKFAGNVIVYPEGVWYGRVTPCNVPILVEKHLLEGCVVHDLYRGAIGGRLPSSSSPPAPSTAADTPAPAEEKKGEAW